MIPPLHPHHLADLRRSGLSDETIQGSRIYTAPPDRLKKLCRQWGKHGQGVLNAYAIPYPGVEGFERYRLFREEGISGPKYLQAPGTSNRLYIPAETDIQGDSLLLVVEGEKKDLSLRQAGFEAVGLPGIWGWCAGGQGYRKPGETWPIPDLDKVNWRRPVTIVFDSDGNENPMVRLAAFRLARELSRRGAVVSILFLPHAKNGEKQGADDFLMAHGPVKLREMLP